MQVVDAGHARVAESNDDVALAQARRARGRFPFHLIHAHAGFMRQTEMANDATRDLRVLSADADVGAAHTSFADQCDGDALGRAGGDREAYSLRGQDDGGVDADHAAGRVDQWASRIAWIEGRIGLDDVVEQASRLT